MNKLLTLGITGALAAGLACAAFAQTSASSEVSTAHAHALMAQHATTLDLAHTHLHHVVNCLVGANGKGFDAAAGDPCKGQGNGALPDASGNSALETHLKAALADAQSGLQTTNMKAAQAAAAKAAAALAATPAAKSSGGAW